MDPASPLLALRLGGQDHALEPGRDYLIGSAPDCDLRLLHGVAPRHARLAIRAGEAELIDLGSPQGTWHNERKVERTMLQIGDLLRLGDTTEAVIVPDHGNALLIPIPALRQAAGARAVRIAAQALRRDSQTFQELMAHELRRAPWFALSLALHLVLAMLLWWLLPNGPPSGAARATVGIELAGDVPEADDGPPSPPEVIAEPESPPLELLQTPEPPAPSEVVPTTSADAAMPRPPELPRDLAPIGHRARATDGASASAGDGQLAGLGSGGFQRTVGELRRSGLEIVFVFDSTGSMTRTIHDTKSSITQMLARAARAGAGRPHRTGHLSRSRRTRTVSGAPGAAGTRSVASGELHAVRQRRRRRRSPRGRARRAAGGVLAAVAQRRAPRGGAGRRRAAASARPAAPARRREGVRARRPLVRAQRW